jgi:shikimate dehydrogenase
MGDDRDVPFDVSAVGPSHVVVDLIYHPRETNLLAQCRDRGATTTNGVGMLLHQAALQFELWTGIEAPLDAMQRSLERELALRRA